MSPALELASVLRRLVRRGLLGVALSGAIAGTAIGQPGFPGEMRDPPAIPDREPIFFPPLPPPLDAPDPSRARGPIHPAPPGEVADYVGEIFYPQLAMRLRKKTLTGSHRRRLAGYRAEKQALQNELRLELLRLREADHATRRTALQALARRQAPRLATLEVAAEALRLDLGSPEHDWSYYRRWHLGDKERRGFSPLEIARVMRALAFFEKRLSVSHRALLREISHEMTLAATDAKRAAAAEPHVFFSPSPARVRLPRDLPRELALKFAEFQSQKAQVKKELYEAAYRHDGRLLLLSNPLAEAAAKQAPQVAELERLAEEIRVALSLLPATRAAAPVSPISPRLAETAASLQRQRLQIQKDATLQLEAVARRARKQGPMRINFAFDTDGLKFAVIPQGRPSPELTARVQAIGAEISAIADDYGRKLTAIVNAEEELRTEIAQAIGSKQPQLVDQALAAAARTYDVKQHAGAYADYRTAVFEPGLSIEQRRLLFESAVARLDLPLPHGELQPWKRADSW